MRLKGRMLMEGNQIVCDSTSSVSTAEDSMNSICSSSSSSSELVEDATSSYHSSPSSSSSSSISKGPLYELSELMVHLPMKRGLSKFYQGKAQSFTSLASVKSIEDLPKKEITPYKKRMKSCKSYEGGLDCHKLYAPKATISKKASRGSFVSLLSKRDSSFLVESRRISFSEQKNL